MTTPDPLKLVFDYAYDHQVSIQVAALTVLPDWIALYPTSPQVDEAAWFLGKAKTNFGKDRA